jgi:hypothetical protein
MQHLLDHVQEIDGVLLKQANAIAAELCTTIQFASHILIGAEGFNNASITIDELLEANEKVRIKVTNELVPLPLPRTKVIILLHLSPNSHLAVKTHHVIKFYTHRCAVWLALIESTTKKTR